MNGATDNWLDQLAPAHAPAPPGWWPPAPGWWLLLAIVIITVTTLAIIWLRPTQRRRRSALRELRGLESGPGDDIALACGLENLLRRYALAQFGRDSVARLSGDSWLAFLAAHGGGALAGDAGRDLLRSAYGGGAPGAARALWLQGARGFLRSRHK
ncbi:DUF4381 domain-containing protein [Solimonas terrae]|uniref:DUF4381 domain-containing protein n=1 Tax=Solimonas terrae TaxID=1396819 RepID=A0A6M2BVZ4_9GAMM|nr:DUF4381 domain-containing protein [Solimonas terrae]NGY06812.1 DUF4381 domain-containing protein [Solimonas terrae]